MERVYVSDLDGTLLDADARLSAATRDAVWRLLDDGVRLGFATARSITSVRQILGDLPLRVPVVTFNGAYLSDLRTLRHLRIHALPESIAADVAERGLATGIPFTLSTTHGDTDHVYFQHPRHFSPAVYEGMAWYWRDRVEADDPRRRRVEDVTVGLVEQVTCVNFIAPLGGGLARLESELAEAHGERISVHRFPNWYSPGWEWLSVHAAEARKCQGVRALMEHAGWDDRELVVFGDAVNDLTMFRSAHHAVAVENAVPELKALAHEVIGHHTDDAVVRYLDRVIVPRRS